MIPRNRRRPSSTADSLPSVRLVPRPRRPHAGIAPRNRRVLRLWRTRPPQDLGPGDRLRLAAVLGSSATGTTAGRRHRRVESALVIGSAVGLLVRRADLAGADADFIMSGLLLHALMDDPACPFILAHALARLARQSPRHAGCGDLSARWRQWRPRPDPRIAPPPEPPAR